MTGGNEPEAAPGDVCPSCGQPVFPGDNFCEACRAELRPARVSGDQPATPVKCPSCPDSLITTDGYCENCGHKVPVAADHAELDLGQLAGVTDRGVRHHRNEDAMALAVAATDAGPVSLAVVCDGVSTSSRPDEAAHAGVQAAMGVLLAAVRGGEDLTAASAGAVRAAQQALDELAGQHSLTANAPSATFVSAVVTSHSVTVCWLGDSRAYWFDAADDTATRQLTRDDSVGQELVNRGLLTEAQALASPQGHVVTGWIGADLSEAKPHVGVFTPTGPGVVLVCSDGLWNYRPEAAGLAELAMPTALTDPLGAAAALVTFAVEAGGADNVTVVLAPFPPPSQNPSGLPDPTEENRTDV